jgi:hypothetical protein
MTQPLAPEPTPPRCACKSGWARTWWCIRPADGPDGLCADCRGSDSCARARGLFETLPRPPAVPCATPKACSWEHYVDTAALVHCVTPACGAEAPESWPERTEDCRCGGCNTGDPA